MKVIITTLPEKLPENVRELIDESRPLPAKQASSRRDLPSAGQSTGLRLGSFLSLLALYCLLSASWISLVQSFLCRFWRASSVYSAGICSSPR